MIRRKKPLKRSPFHPGGVSSRLTRRRKLKGKKRSAAEAERVYGSQEFRDWLHAQPCCIWGVRGGIEAAHVKTGGMGRKADWRWTVPMFFRTHRELHAIGQRTFEAKYGVDLIALAEETQRRWQDHLTRSAAA